MRRSIVVTGGIAAFLALVLRFGAGTSSLNPYAIEHWPSTAVPDCYLGQECDPVDVGGLAGVDIQVRYRHNSDGVIVFGLQEQSPHGWRTFTRNGSVLFACAAISCTHTFSFSFTHRLAPKLIPLRVHIEQLPPGANGELYVANHGSFGAPDPQILSAALKAALHNLDTLRPSAVKGKSKWRSHSISEPLTHF